MIDWIDIFTRKNYRDIVIDSFRYCMENKGLQLCAYVIMSNHVHIIAASSQDQLSDTIRDFKRHTATQILKTIHSPKESRRVWMLQRFALAASHHNRNQKYQFWTHENHAVKLVTKKFVLQKCNYIHNNPVRAGWVADPSDWLYSSASNYEGKGGLLAVQLLDALYSI